MVTIKNMRMPNNCAYCIFRLYGRCYITDKIIHNYNCPQIKDGDCPLAGEEIYTKDDMVDMLEKIQLEIEKKAIRKQGIDSGFEYDYEFISSEEVIEVIQQKINSLKENKDE